MMADAFWSPELVVAGVTYGGATYSIGPSKILGGDAQILESAVIARAKDCQNDLIT
jgi:predicted phage tail protein